MEQSKEEILQLFREDISSADTTLPDGGVLSERDEVCIIYYAHYSQYRDSFDEIIEENPKFFDFT